MTHGINTRSSTNQSSPTTIILEDKTEEKTKSVAEIKIESLGSLLTSPGADLNKTWQPFATLQEAKHYRSYSFVQKDWACETLSKLTLKGLVVDVGCGEGDLAIHIAKANPCKVLALDISPFMIALGKESNQTEKISNVEFEQADAASFSLKEPADTFLILNTLHWTANPIVVLQNAYKNLKPGGNLVITGPGKRQSFLGNILNKIAEIKEWNQYFSETSEINMPEPMLSSDELEKVLEQIGFVDVEVKVEDKYQQFLDAYYLKEWLRTSIVIQALPASQRETYLATLMATINFNREGCLKNKFISTLGYKLEARATKPKS